VSNTSQATTAEAALADLISWLRIRIERQPNGDGQSLEPYGFDLYHDFLQAKLNTYPIQPFDPQIVRAKLPYLDAIWDLCGRGVLRPSAVLFDGGRSVAVGNHFALMPYGLQWLQNPGLSEANPMEYGRFAQFLARHDTRFGDAYRLRASEAVRCYEGRTYFACCAMCGAGAESVLLALATARLGEEEALRDYQRSGGRGRVRNRLVSTARLEIQNSFDSYLQLISYWRDESAHGVARAIGEEEAFTSLLLLLRFANLADSEWDSLTTSQAGGGA
jgi:hypothetical protein